MPLTIFYWLMAETAFVGKTLEWALITVGVVGDLLQQRERALATDLHVPGDWQNGRGGMCCTAISGSRTG